MLTALLVSIPALLVLLALGVALATHPYAGRIGWRYLRSKKRQTVSVITTIAVSGVALGVAALLAVMSITSGFQEEFRNKVLGVNAHVLVLKYGLDFEEYREVVERAREMPEVAGAAPFLINEMMLAKGDRISGVLVKGVDPELMPTVLDLPSQMTQGGLDGLRRPGASAPTSPDDLMGPVDGDWEWLDELADDGTSAAAGSGAGAAPPPVELPDVDVPSPDEVNAAMADLDADGAELPGDDAVLDDPVLDDAPPGQRTAGDDPLAELLDEVDAPAPDDVNQAMDDAELPPADAPLDLAALDADETEFQTVDELPAVDVPSPEQAEQALGGEGEGDDGALPDDQLIDQFLEEERLIVEGEDGAQEELASLPGIVVGVTLAESLGLGVGDRVSVISPLAGLDTSMFTDRPSNAPRSREFRVIGIFEAGFQEYDSRLVYVDLFEAQHFFDHGDSVTGVEITLHDLEEAPEISRRLERVLGGGPYHTMDWQELNHNLFTALVIQKVALTVVTSCIIVVAALVVIATLIIAVLEKKREIAILKAMGARSFGVLLVFMVQGLVIGLIGTALGLLIGGGVCWYLAAIEYPLDPHVYLIDHVPVRISSAEFIVTIAITLMICVAATIVPSWWAARLLPADGVRYE